MAFICEHTPILKQLPEKKWTKKEIKNKLSFYNLKIITAFRNQNINIICSYDIDLTRNAGKRLFKKLDK